MSQTVQHFICVTCGIEYPESAKPPEGCPVCQDDRQFIPPEGQQWTTLDEMRGKYHNVMEPEEPGLFSIHTEPAFAITQRAFLIATPDGNILWDCLTMLDDATISAVRERGGIQAIAISHPHYYSSMVEWSRAFDAPIFLHENDWRWVMRPDPGIQFWRGDARPFIGGTTLINTAGHFPGAQALHWPAGAEGRGAIFSGDQPQVCYDRQWLSFMYSYPNWLPLGPTAVQRTLEVLRPFDFDRIYGAFQKRTIARDGKQVLERSVERYLRAITA